MIYEVFCKGIKLFVFKFLYELEKVCLMFGIILELLIWIYFIYKFDKLFVFDVRCYLFDLFIKDVLGFLI